ncbi:MAG: type IIL restriction-modification enzyme MmeI [Gemmatimonadales bacterium]
MQLADRLAALNRLTDLPTLAPLLGLEPCWSPITLESLGASFAALPGAVFGRHDGFVAFGVEAGPAADSARRLATVLARRGSQALVAAVEPGRRRLALAVAVPDCPVATISLDRIRAVDERILARGRNQQAATALARSVGWAEALSGRSLDDRFYREFRAVLADAAAALPGRIPAEQRHGLALLSLSRILFLYFVQERGWLDGRPRFLREELDRVMANGGGVERRYLRPLFFGTLNRPADRRTSRARQFGRIPFLNGGLFEPHPLERRWKAELPDTVWSAAFERIFERYHFTIAPETGPRSRIGPDMLGLVFERVMDPADRRQTGAFYTPAPLVDRLVDDALDQWLAAALRVPPTEARVLLQRPSAASLEAVRKIRVLDPAAGTSVRFSSAC